ncbi:MAG: tripartite tricarboxylate transporter permease [Chloroflexi bacterium]|nr:tripartite tricarboxylate transporter permease [Chloroflexota bacterium]
MVLEAFGQAILNFGSLELWFYITLGVVIGLVLGVTPGIGALTGLALVLPFVFVMPPSSALALMIALGSVACTGGSMTSILLNVPGTTVNAATLIDGYPMSQMGQAGRALGAALASSAAGGVATVFFAFAMVPLIIPLVVALRSADMVFLVLLGLAFIAVLGRESMAKGLLSGVLGVTVSFIGVQVKTAVPRFTFDNVYLYDGLPFAPVVLGLFAVPEMIALAVMGGSIARSGVLDKGIGGVMEGVKDVGRHWWLWLRCSVIGYVIGVIPGIGATAATFIAYGHAKQTSKNPHEFGTGRVEGVIAPESANNAKEAGSLLTTLAFGIPGSAEMTFLLGALLIIGVIPGPEMITKHLPLSLTLFLIIIVSNLMAGAICFALTSHVARLALVPSHILIPPVLTITFVGTYAARQEFNDLIVLMAFGFIGLAMREFGYNRPALLLGFVLGTLLEKYLFLALGVAGPLFFVRPISLALILMTVGVIVFNPIRDLLARRSRTAMVAVTATKNPEVSGEG